MRGDLYDAFLGRGDVLLYVSLPHVNGDASVHRCVERDIPYVYISIDTKIDTYMDTDL